MKLHKMAFFIQKETFSKYKKPMFEEDFEGWKLGPVCRVIIKNFEEIQKFKGKISIKEENKKIVDLIFEKYKDTNSYELSRLTHLEFSWIKSRIGIQANENGKVISKNDIYNDAIEE